jgi:tripartite-type tricarboxylate transporter receptor subunit TctC
MLAKASFQAGARHQLNLAKISQGLGREKPAQVRANGRGGMKHVQKNRSCITSGFLAGVMIAGWTTSLAAQDVASFYAGKNVEMVVGYPPGGSNDLYARLVANHIGKHIPGSPRIITQNMPGAGSLLAANHLYASSAKDGTILGAVSQGIPLQGRLGHPQARYVASKFNWLGRIAPSGNVTMVWHTSKARSFDDALKNEIVLGATGAGSTVALYPSVMNEILKTKFKIVMGYKGSPEAMLAMERGEVEGHSTTWDVVKAVQPGWIKEGKLRFLVQHSLTRNPDLADVPTSVELAKNDADRAVMRTIMSSAEVGKAYFTTPGVPADRVSALRRAFDSMLKDPQFVDGLHKLGGDLVPLKGEEVQKLIAELDDLPNDLIERVKAVYNEQ